MSDQILQSITNAQTNRSAAIESIEKKPVVEYRPLNPIDKSWTSLEGLYKGVYNHALLLFQQKNQVQISAYINEKYKTLTTNQERETFKKSVRDAKKDYDSKKSFQKELNQTKKSVTSNSNFKYDYKLKERNSDFHFWQKYTPNGVSQKVTNNGCIAASYIMAKSMVDPSFQLSKENYKKALTDLNITKEGGLMRDLSAFMNIPKHELYTREQAKDVIRNSLAEGKPLVARVLMKGNTVDNNLVSSENKWNNDKAIFTTKGEYSHAVVIVGLQETADGKGSFITYIDPMIKDPKNAVKTISYSDFLNSMMEPKYEVVSIR